MIRQVGVLRMFRLLRLCRILRLLKANKELMLLVRGAAAGRPASLRNPSPLALLLFCIHWSFH